MSNRCTQVHQDIYINTADNRYWHFQGEKFYNKFQALDYSKGKHTDFYMYDDAFAGANRTPVDCKQIFQARAKQIRSKYDYVRLWFSGGKDSITMLESFLQAGCRIDEVVIMFSSINNNPWATNDLELTVALQELQKRNVKFTKLQITFDHYKHLYLDIDNYFTKVAHGMIYFRPVRISTAYTLWPELLKPHNSGMNVVELVGDQRPTMRKKDGKVWFYFLDADVETLGSPNAEDFFISEDMPEVHIAQCHGLANYLDSIAVDEDDWNRLSDYKETLDYQRIARRANSYGRTLPDHPLLISNMLGKSSSTFNYNFKQEYSILEVEQYNSVGKQIIEKYHKYKQEIDNKYTLANPTFPTSCYSVFHSLTEPNVTADNTEIL